MTISVSSVLTNVKTVLNDAGLVHWTQDELLAWGSEGQVELVKMNADAATKTATLNLVAGAKQSSPADCIKILDITRNNDGSSITPCDREALDSFSPDWMTSPTATGVKHWMADAQPDTFYVYPAQSNTPAVVVITYSFVPPALTVGGNLGVRDMYQAQIENYILFRALSKDSASANAGLAAAYGQAFYGSSA